MFGVADFGIVDMLANTSVAVALLVGMIIGIVLVFGARLIK